MGTLYSIAPYELTESLLMLVQKLEHGWYDYQGLFIQNRHDMFPDGLTWRITRGTPVHSPYEFSMICDYHSDGGHSYSATLRGSRDEFDRDMTVLSLLRR
jgi:hypothetical protein